MAAGPDGPFPQGTHFDHGRIATGGVKFQSLTEAIDTGNAFGTLIFQIIGAIAEFERNLIVERTKAGLEAAKKRGRVGGRKPSLTEKKVTFALEQKRRQMEGDASISHESIALELKVATSTLHRAIQRFKELHPERYLEILGPVAVKLLGGTMQQKALARE